MPSQPDSLHNTIPQGDPHTTPLIVTLPLPEYTLDTDLDYEAIGARIDKAILEHFPDGDYINRSVGLCEHPGKTREELVSLILAHGTDLYDPERVSIHKEGFSDYQFDIHAETFSIRNGTLRFIPDCFQSCFAETIYDFAHNAILDRGYPVRVDVIMLYDRAALLPAIQTSHQKPSAVPYSPYLYRFKPGVEGKGLRGVVVLGE